ncbi:MAG: phosphate-selective porin OprO/OprP [Lentisphaeria bacterium]|jgi:phosphate-selective porin OprO/OprP
MQLDYNYAALNRESQENNAEVRRACLTLSGHAYDWYFLSRFDVDQGSGSNLLSSYMQYRDFGEKAWVSVGRMKEPFGMSWLGSIKNIAIPERYPVSDGYTFGRSAGVLVEGKLSAFSYALGVFEAGEVGTEQEEENVAITGRVYSALILNPVRVLHVGGAFSSRSEQNAVALEFAFVNGPVHL